ncbi:MAG: carbon monoxide dehydrogenase subunit G [Pseudomonadota bacterium]
MELTGEHKIPAPRKVVWDALHDVELLKECIKGCQSLEMVDDRHMTGRIQAKVGPVKATFDAAVEIVDPVAPERYTLQGEGKGGVAGFAKGSADVVLTEDGNETILNYTANAKIGGKLAQLGSRLVDSTAKKYASDFFSEFSERVGTASVTPQPTEAAAAPAPSQDETPEETAVAEVEMATASPAIDPPHAEDTAADALASQSAKGAFGGAWLWGILAFAAVIIVLIALQ